MLNDGERTDARRFLGYAAHGASLDGNSGWQFYQVAGEVEYRLSNLSASEGGVARRYLGTLAALELAIPGVGAGLDTDRAAGWVRNPAELRERMALFDDWRRRFCGFLGVPPGPSLRGVGSTVGLVV